MKIKLFKKNIKPDCKYCVFSSYLSNSENLICIKQGLIDTNYSCKKFKYEPLKRKPYLINIQKNYSKTDFSLD